MDAHGVTAPTIDELGTILDELLDSGIACAPHVLAKVSRDLAHDRPTIVAVLGVLDPAQCAGLRPLPATLPVVDLLRERFEGVVPEDRDRDLLLAAAIGLDDRLDTLTAFDGRSAEEIASGEIGRHLRVHAGRAAFADPRLAIWLRGTSTPAVRNAVHMRLSNLHRARGDRAAAAWHSARASLRGDAGTAAELTRVARDLSETGSSDRALLLASEAVDHLTGAEREEAMVIAGVSALAAGYAAEAAVRLSGLFPDGTERLRLQALGGLIVAHAHLHGAVPHIDFDAFRPRSADQESWHFWARATALAAVLSAERDDRVGMHRWLLAMREACARTGEKELRDPVVALSWLLTGDRTSDVVSGTGPFTGSMLSALRAAMDGDPSQGLRLLATDESGFAAEPDPFVAGFESSALIAAHRAVLSALMQTWRGDIGSARRQLIHAATELPVGMPFSGLGLVLLRRLDLAVDGRLGPFSRALTAAQPPPLRADQHVDQGIEAYLDGSVDASAALVRLWLDRGAPQPAFAVPGLEEVVFGADREPLRPHHVEPPDFARAERLRERITRSSDDEWRLEHESVADGARMLESPFLRGRVEAMIGTRCLIRGDVVAGRMHLETAQRLLEMSGAAAWARSVSRRLTRLSADGRLGEPSRDPLAACRRVWEPILTRRELDVAVLTVGGATNRDIAAELHVSVRTVEVHLSRVFTKLEVRSRVELTVFAHRIGRFI